MKQKRSLLLWLFASSMLFAHPTYTSFDWKEFTLNTIKQQWVGCLAFAASIFYWMPRVNRLNHQVDQANNKVANLKKVVETTKKQNEKVQKLKENLDSQGEQLDKQATVIGTWEYTLRQSNEQRNKQYQEHESRISQLEKNYQQLSTYISTMNAPLNTAISELKNTNKQLTETTSGRYQEYLKKIAELENSRSQIQKDIGTLKEVQPITITINGIPQNGEYQQALKPLTENIQLAARIAQIKLKEIGQYHEEMEMWKKNAKEKQKAETEAVKAAITQEVAPLTAQINNFANRLNSTELDILTYKTNQLSNKKLNKTLNGKR